MKNYQRIKEELQNWPELLKNYQKPDTTKAVIQILNSFIPFLGLWVLMYFSLRVGYWLTFLLGLVNAFFLVRIFIIQHDCGHRSFLKSRRWMDGIGMVCSLFSSVPFRYWAKQHDYHHAHNGQLDQRDYGDIKTFTVRQYREMSKMRRLRYRLFRHPIVLFVLGPMFYLAVHNRLPVVRHASFKPLELSLHVSNVLIIGLYVMLVLLLGWNFLIVQASILAPFAIISVWFFYVQHQHEHTYKRFRENWEYLLSAVRGSSFYRLPALVHWLTGNIGFHHIHHLNPRIPNYNLRRCFKENPTFTKYANSLNFIQSLKTMTHKLWDEQSQRMITFREFYRMEAQLS